MRRPGCLFFDLFEVYIIFGRATRGRVALLGARRLLRLCLLLVIFTHSIPHVPELLPDMARCAEYGHQEVEHKLVQQIKNNDEKKYFG